MLCMRRRHKARQGDCPRHVRQVGSQALCRRDGRRTPISACVRARQAARTRLFLLRSGALPLLPPPGPCPPPTPCRYPPSPPCRPPYAPPLAAPPSPLHLSPSPPHLHLSVPLPVPPGPLRWPPPRPPPAASVADSDARHHHRALGAAGRGVVACRAPRRIAIRPQLPGPHRDHLIIGPPGRWRHGAGVDWDCNRRPHCSGACPQAPHDAPVRRGKRRPPLPHVRPTHARAKVPPLRWRQVRQIAPYAAILAPTRAAPAAHPRGRSAALACPLALGHSSPARPPAAPHASRMPFRTRSDPPYHRAEKC